MKRSQIAVSNYPYHKMSQLGMLNSLERMGISNMEFLASEPDFYLPDVGMREARELKQMLMARGLNMICLSIPCNECSVNLASQNPYTRTRSIEYIVKGIQFANFFETPVVQFIAGEALFHEEEGAALRRAEDSLRFLADIADGYGVKILNSYTDNPQTNVLCSAKDVACMHNKLGADRFLKMSDTVYMHRLNESVDSIAELFGETLYMIHFADCKGSAQHLAPGEGELNLEDYVKQLNDVQYKGYLTLNMRGARTPYSYEVEPGRCMEQGVHWLLEHTEDD